MVNGVYKRTLNLKEYAACLFHDCSVKSKPDKVKHSLYSAEIAKPILTKTGYFTPEEVEEVCQAIVEHDGETNPNFIHSTLTSDVLSSADTNPPNVAWILNKMYVYRLRHNRPAELIFKDIAEYSKEAYGLKSKRKYPTLYANFYGKEIVTMGRTIDSLTPEDCERIIMDYRARHKLGPNDLVFPDPSLESIAVEALSPDISKKKAAIIKYICDVCDILDPSKTNSKRYHRILDHMTDKEFDQWMNYVKEGKWQIHIVAPNMIVNLRNENILKAADKVGCKLFHRLWIDDPTTGRKYLTDDEYLILNLPVRRQQQFLDETMSVPEHDRTIDGMTGQVTGDSRACSVTNPEIQILAARGLDATLEEFVNVRGGNMHAYAEFRRQAEETGEISLNSLDPNTRSRVAVVGQVLVNSMMLDTNIVE